MNSPKGKRIFALALAVLMALSLLVPSLSLLIRAEDYDGQDQIDDLSDQFKDLQAKEKEIQKRLAATQGEKQQQLAYQQELGRQLNNTISQIDLLNERIATLNENISIKEEELEIKQAEYDATYERFKLRFRAMCSTQNASTLGLVLGAQDFSEVLTFTEVSTRIAAYDQQIMEELAQERKDLEEVKAIIETSRQMVEEDRGTLDGKKVELGTQEQQAKSRVFDISAQEQQFKANQQEIQKQMAQVQAEINEIYKEINKTSTQIPYVGGEMRWPSNTITQISSEFGMRDLGGANYHTGLDIWGSNAYGSAVLAANTGTVVVAKNTYSGYDYGKYIIIDHGGGVQTLYAHNSALSVSVGDVVVTGQKIAEVGQTGWATGPHIHFEVRVNGKSKNPMDYLTP